MKQESHRRLGRYLVGQLDHAPKRRHRTAFLIGCVEPDRNPFSYLKGSLRSKLFYGHNYQNADRWIDRSIRVLARRNNWKLWDYYRLGKLIHYASDAFTYAHNNCFNAPIQAHLAYENALQEQFLRRLHGTLPEDAASDLPDFRRVHEQYLRSRKGVASDCRYILDMTGCLFLRLWP